MEDNSYSIREIKVTAMVYATSKELVEQVRTIGKLPKNIAPGGFHIAARFLIERRGTDPTLTEDEKLVFDAIVRERRLPGGGVRLVDEYDV